MKKYKKNYAKYLPKIGSTAVVALAMSVALANPANATEIEDPTPIDIPPLDNDQVDIPDTPDELAEANGAIAQENQDTLKDNQDTQDHNDSTNQSNQDTAASNEALSGGKLVNPDLENPEAPANPETGDLDAEGYNDAIGGYNGQVDGYGDSVDEYNKQVDEYNKNVDQFNQQEQDRVQQETEDYTKAEYQHKEAEEKHEADLDQQSKDAAAYEQYLKDKEAYEKANADYLEALDKYEASLNENLADEAAREQYLKDKEAYDKAAADYQAALGQYESSLSTPDAGSEAYQQYLQDRAAYDQACADYLEALNKYNSETLPSYEEDSEAYKQYLQDKAAYDKAYADYLEALYNYNKDVLPEYAEKAEQVEKEQAILDDVNRYNSDVAAKNEQIQNANDTLLDNIDVGVAESLKDVASINQNVNVDAETMRILGEFALLKEEQDTLAAAGAALANHPGKSAPLGSAEYDAYLNDVAKHNAAVDTFNLKVAAYNTAVETYNAAVNTFNEKQTDSSTSTPGQVESTGTADWGNFENKNLYFNHIDVRYHAAEVQNPDGTTNSKYDVVGVYYDKNEQDAGSDNYGVTYTNIWGTAVDYDMVKDNAHDEFGTASTDRNGDIDRTDANANKNTVVTFYATLKEGNELKHITVELDANSVYAPNSYVKYDSGDHLNEFRFGTNNKDKLQLVEIDGELYYDVSGQSVFLISALVCDGYAFRMGGLDLVLNVQTMIDIHQADNAKKLGFLTYELEKYAATEDQTLSDPGSLTPAPSFDGSVVTPVADPGKRPDAPTFNPGEFDRDSVKDAVVLEYLEHIDKLDKLEEKFIIEFVEPEAPTPTPDPTPAPTPAPAPVVAAADGLVVIEDEDVPLADAPQTGDISSLFAAISSFSLGGLLFLNRKRKDEE